MKNKILLSTLLGGALLAGCTADDVLDVNKAAVKVNPDAPVFNVSLVDDGTTMRGDMSEGSMKWDTKNDKLSLYHGGGKVTGTGKSWAVAKHTGSDDFLTDGKIRDFDAIYAQTSNADGVARLTTESVVSEGFAIMVYPADTAYKQTGLSPVLRIPNEQDASTKNLTPHVSEVLTIGEYSNNAPKNTAGYGREYDVALRRVAGQMRLQLDAENKEALEKAGVTDIKYRTVKVTVTGGEEGDEVVTNPFTTEAVVKIGQPRYTEGQSDIPADAKEVGLNPKDGSLAHWSYTPWIEPVTDEDGNIEASNWISTTDIIDNEGNIQAIYTLLPYDDREDYETAVYEEEGKPKYTKVEIDVETYYGLIKVVELTDKKVWKNANNEELTLVDGLSALMVKMFAPYTDQANKETYTRYRNQLLPYNGLGKITVDWSKLIFDQLHITSSDQLRDVLKVYNALYPDAVNGEEATLILDGDSKGVFTMNQDAWELVEAQLKKDGNKVKFAPCESHGMTKAPTGCVTVRLTNNGEIDVPELNFEKNSLSTNGVELELTGDWTYTSKNDANNTVTYKNLKIGGVQHIHVTSGAKLTLVGQVAADEYATGATSEVGIVVDYNGKVETSGVVELAMNLENMGTIEIPATSQLQVVNNKILTNRETQDTTQDPTKSYYTATGSTTAKVGIINVYGNLGIGSNSGTDTAIKNLGYIYQKLNTARVSVTTNADLDGSKETESPFARKGWKDAENTSGTGASNNHIYGSIVLADATGGNRVNVKNINDHTQKEAGFIKIKITKDNPVKADFANANYVILGEGCKTISCNKDDDGNFLNVPQSIKYVEVDTGSELEIAGTTRLDIRALVVKNGSQVQISYGTSVFVAQSIYVEDYIYNSGKLGMKSTATFAGYFGGDTSDESKYVSTGNTIDHNAN